MSSEDIMALISIMYTCCGDHETMVPCLPCSGESGSTPSNSLISSKGMETMALQTKDNDQGWQSGNSIAVENLATKGLLIAG